MKVVVLLAMVLVGGGTVWEVRAEDLVLPALHKIKTVTLSPSYSCRPKEEFQRGYENTALFLSTRRGNAPELLFNGACGSPDYFDSTTAGDQMGVMADLGELPLEKVTAHLAFNTHHVHSFELYSKFTQVAAVQPKHTYAVLIDRAELRSLFVFTVIGYVPNKKVDLRYAVKEYQFLQIRAQSPGFDWGTETTADPGET